MSADTHRHAAFALLHGGGQGGWVWEETAARLDDSGADVAILDVPGCGAKRGLEAIQYGVAETVAGLAREIGGIGRRVVLVGHSQAGTLLPGIWRSAPERLSGLIYLACAAPPPGRSIVDLMGQGPRGSSPGEVGWPLDPDTTPLEDMRRATLCNDMPPDVARRFLARLDRDSWPPGVTHAVHWEYSGLEACPSTYVICTRDVLLPPTWQRRFARRLACKRIVELDAGHQPMISRPGALADLLLAEAGRLTSGLRGT